MRSLFFCTCLLLLSACATQKMPEGYYTDRNEAKLAPLRQEMQVALGNQLAKSGLAEGSPIFIRIFKLENTLEVWMEDKQDQGRYRLFQSFPICSFSGTLGPKLMEGDKQSPEGFYEITPEQLHPQSEYHLAMNIGFPNQYDQALNRTGSFLMIHGGCKSIGCFAMRDKGIEEIYFLAEAAFKNGQPSIPVHIFPFHLTAENIEVTQSHSWYPFWANLKQGYDMFEMTRIPPIVSSTAGAYRIASRAPLPIQYANYSLKELE